MSFFNVTESQIKTDLYNKVKKNLQTKKITNYNVGGILRGFIEIVGYFIYLFYQLLEKIFLNVFAHSATEDIWLDEKVAEIGLERNPATKAEGNFVCGRETLDTTNIIIDAGKIIKTETDSTGNQYSYEVTEETILPANTLEILVPVKSLGTGTSYNIVGGTNVKLANPIDGIDFVTVPTDWTTTPAEDKETNKDLYERYKIKWQSENEGGVAYYKTLALSVAGVKDVSVVPTMNGAGTLGVIITSTAGPASAELVTAVQTLINDNLYFDGIVVTVAAAEELSHTIDIVFDLYSSFENQAAEDTFKASVRTVASSYITAKQGIGVDFVPFNFKKYLADYFGEDTVKNITLSNESVIVISNTKILSLTIDNIYCNTEVVE